MIKWIKNNWKDPVWSKVFAAGILAIPSGIIILFRTISENISLYNSIIEFSKLINSKISIPLWLIIIVVFFLVVLNWKNCFIIMKNTINSNEKTKKKKPEQIKNLQEIEGTTIEASQQGRTSITNKFLSTDFGIFNIWAYITDNHNRIHSQRKYMYIVGYATNGGNPLKNPILANYQNAWAIARMTPTEKDNYGTWRFWCNNTENVLTRLDYKKPLSGGWHLFSVAWSKNDNFIKFIIDCEVVIEDKFCNWPSDFSGTMMLGTWANKAVVHNFDSKVGPWKFIESNYKELIIKEYFDNKPE